MKNFLIFIPLTILYLSFKTTIAPMAPLPDITLLIVMFIPHDKASVRGVFLAFILGYINDVFSGGIIGVSSFSLVAVYALVFATSGRLRFSAITVTVGAAFVLSLVNGILSMFVLRIADVEVVTTRQMALILLGSVITGLFAPVFIRVFIRLKRYADKRLKRGLG